MPTDGESHYHCFHEMGSVLLSDPPKHVEVCCWCGKKQYSVAVEPKDDKKHGTFVIRKDYFIEGL